MTILIQNKLFEYRLRDSSENNDSDNSRGDQGGKSKAWKISLKFDDILRYYNRFNC